MNHQDYGAGCKTVFTDDEPKKCRACSSPAICLEMITPIGVCYAARCMNDLCDSRGVLSQVSVSCAVNMWNDLQKER